MKTPRPNSDPKRAKREPVIRPLLGFGPIGVVLVLVLIGLIVIECRGMGLQYEIQKLIAYNIGGDALLWITARHAVYYINSPLLGFSPWGMLYLLPALHIAPRRYSLWAICLLVAAWLIEPWLRLQWFLLITELEKQYGAPHAILHALLIWSNLPAQLLTFAAIAILVRSRYVIVVTGIWLLLLLLISPIWMEVGWSVPMSVGHSLLLSSILHIPYAYMLFRWAIRQRRKALRQPYLCKNCDYDLRGTNSGMCPECGAQIATA